MSLFFKKAQASAEGLPAGESRDAHGVGDGPRGKGPGGGEGKNSKTREGRDSEEPEEKRRKGEEGRGAGRGRASLSGRRREGGEKKTKEEQCHGGNLTSRR